jgi:hypothetical protein
MNPGKKLALPMNLENIQHSTFNFHEAPSILGVEC